MLMIRSNAVPPKHISSKDNAIYKRLRLALRDNTSYRDKQLVWIEGEHLCKAAVEHGLRFKELVLLDTKLTTETFNWLDHADQLLTMTAPLMQGLSQLPSSTWLLASIEMHETNRPDPLQSMVVLDQIQDPGNAGSILRCAAAFGFNQIITTPGTVSMWSPKVVRAAMGSHFGLKLFEAVQVADVLAFGLPVLVTDVHQGTFLHERTGPSSLPWPCAWVFGHEGQGISDGWMPNNSQRIRIVQPGGQESLNVAAAAAICLHASAVERIEKF
jgi:TrmH family RNA methyltransferase